jgi:hypothetical protein
MQVGQARAAPRFGVRSSVVAFVYVRDRRGVCSVISGESGCVSIVCVRALCVSVDALSIERRASNKACSVSSAISWLLVARSTLCRCLSSHRRRAFTTAAAHLQQQQQHVHYTGLAPPPTRDLSLSRAPAQTERHTTLVHRCAVRPPTMNGAALDNGAVVDGACDPCLRAHVAFERLSARARASNEHGDDAKR